MPKRRLFTRRHSRGPSFFGGLSATALAGALVLVMLSPAHAPTPAPSYLQAHAAQMAPPAPAPVAAPAPRLQPEARSSLQVFPCQVQASCRFEVFAPRH